MSADWQATVVTLLLTDTRDMAELARIAGRDPAEFWAGADLSGIDLGEQDWEALGIPKPASGVAPLYDIEEIKKDIGTLIRQAREAKGLSISEAQANLKGTKTPLTYRIIENIEAGDFSPLPFQFTWRYLKTLKIDTISFIQTVGARSLLVPLIRFGYCDERYSAISDKRYVTYALRKAAKALDSFIEELTFCAEENLEGHFLVHLSQVALRLSEDGAPKGHPHVLIAQNSSQLALEKRQSLGDSDALNALALRIWFRSSYQVERWNLQYNKTYRDIPPQNLLFPFLKIIDLSNRAVDSSILSPGDKVDQSFWLDIFSFNSIAIELYTQNENRLLKESVRALLSNTRFALYELRASITPTTPSKLILDLAESLVKFLRTWAEGIGKQNRFNFDLFGLVKDFEATYQELEEYIDRTTLAKLLMQSGEMYLALSKLDHSREQGLERAHELYRAAAETFFNEDNHPLLSTCQSTIATILSVQAFLTNGQERKTLLQQALVTTQQAARLVEKNSPQGKLAEKVRQSIMKALASA